MIINVNVKDFDKVKKAMDELIQNVGDPFEKVIEGGAQEIRKEAVRSIQQDPKTGIVYQRYNPRRRHQSSAKGQSPASDTGFLVSQIKVRKKNANEVLVESTAPYSAFLEFGTSIMGERPFMHPAAMKAFPKIAKAVFNKVVEKVREFKV